MTAPCPLTPSQVALVRELATGATYPEVARTVGRSREGVKSALMAARHRAGARNSVHLVALALTNGWLQ